MIKKKLEELSKYLYVVIRSRSVLKLQIETPIADFLLSLRIKVLFEEMVCDLRVCMLVWEVRELLFRACCGY